MIDSIKADTMSQSHTPSVTLYKPSVYQDTNKIQRGEEIIGGGGGGLEIGRHKERERVIEREGGGRVTQREREISILSEAERHTARERQREIKPERGRETYSQRETKRDKARERQRDIQPERDKER